MGVGLVTSALQEIGILPTYTPGPLEVEMQEIGALEMREMAVSGPALCCGGLKETQLEIRPSLF
jgi:hypothetical protein